MIVQRCIISLLVCTWLIGIPPNLHSSPITVSYFPIFAINLSCISQIRRKHIHYATPYKSPGFEPITPEQTTTPGPVDRFSSNSTLNFNGNPICDLILQITFDIAMRRLRSSGGWLRCSSSSTFFGKKSPEVSRVEEKNRSSHDWRSNRRSYWVSVSVRALGDQLNNALSISF